MDDAGREAWTLMLDLVRADSGRLHESWDELGLTGAQGTLLDAVHPQAGSSMVSLARALRCHDSNITGLVDKLEARGLVERRPAPRDRRVKLVTLTPAGHQAVADLRRKLFTPPPFITRLSAQDQALLLDVLQRAAHPADRAPDAG